MLTVAIIGVGNRGINYARLSKMHGGVKFTAFCDVDESKLNNVVKELDCKDAKLFLKDDDFFSAGKLADILYICSQDRYHYAQAIKALDLGYHILMEKPVSPDPMDCVRIAKKAEEVNKNVFVCHVLRYSAFYRKIKEVLSQGILGDVMLVQHDEHVSYSHFATSYVRGPWSKEEESTCMLMAKCCHDMDLLYWWLGPCKSVSSTGSLTYFKPENAPEGATKRCKDCPHVKTCYYYCVAQQLPVDGKAPRLPFLAKAVYRDQDTEALKQKILEGNQGRCVFYCGNNVCDRQTANLVFDNNGKEVLAQFSVTGFSNEGYRSTHIFGTKGELYADDLTETITLHVQDEEPKVLKLELADETMYNGGHVGGDIGLIADVLDYFEGKDIPYSNLTPIQETIESHLIVGACENSRHANGALTEVHSK